jgi:hypothetical protein
VDVDHGRLVRQASVIKKVLAKAIGGDLAALALDTLGECCRRSRQGGTVPLKIGFSRGFLASDLAPAG